MVTPFLPVLHYFFFMVVLWCALIDNCIGKQVFQRNRNAYKLRISPFVIINNLSINIKIRMLWERKRETPAAHRRLHPMETARCLPGSIRAPLAGFESWVISLITYTYERCSLIPSFTQCTCFKPSWSSAFPGRFGI